MITTARKEVVIEKIIENQDKNKIIDFYEGEWLLNDEFLEAFSFKKKKQFLEINLVEN